MEKWKNWKKCDISKCKNFVSCLLNDILINSLVYSLKILSNEFFTTFCNKNIFCIFSDFRHKMLNENTLV